MNIKKFFGSRKFKYGSVALVLSVVFVALVLVFNFMLTVIGQKYSIYADLTTEEFYTVSDSGKALLENVELPVEIVFFQKRDDIPDPTKTANALGYVKYLAEEFKKSFDFVDVKYIAGAVDALLRLERKLRKRSDFAAHVEGRNNDILVVRAHLLTVDV